MTNHLTQSPQEFVKLLRSLGTSRAYFVRDMESNSLVASHLALDPIAKALTNNERDYKAHEAIFLEASRDEGALMGAFLHRTVRGQGQGGLRLWQYRSLGAFVGDGLRLAEGMGRKNALAGLWWGGGKGLIDCSERALATPETRRALYQQYGLFVSSLNGLYVTAEDVGTRPSDIAEVAKTTRFVTCIPAQSGGSGNPSAATARGVVCAMEASLDFLKLGDLSNKTICMQGAGNVGGFMIDELLQRGVARIVASDVDPTRTAQLAATYRDKPVEIRLAQRGNNDILFEDCDILAPNALGGVLTEETIPKLHCKVVCGAANNQLLNEETDATRIAQRGILYVPDFVANRMGIVNCANEQYGRLQPDPAIERHFDPKWSGSVYQTVLAILERAREGGHTPNRAALELATELARVEHPVFGHRGRAIVQALVQGRWQDGASGGPSGAT